MKKHLLIFGILCFTATTGFSQSTDDVKASSGQTSFFAELGGAGVLFSANIDRRFKPSRLGLGWRLGVGFITNDEDYIGNNGVYMNRNESVVTFPAQINYIFGKETSPHTFEVGAGVTYLGKKIDVYTFTNDRMSQLYGSFSFMYRRQPKDGGLSWRIGFTPLIAKGYIQPAAGLSIGFNF